MFAHNRKETCGRYADKPEKKKTKDEVELYEEAEPIQQKIENLRTKIALQERYNAALKDNLEETATGNYTVLRTLFSDVQNLRFQLRDAVQKEKWAVNNALRTHRIFQLALKGCTPDLAISFMDDKLFDNAKLLNAHLDRLATKRKRLESSEEAVAVLEKWPIPGSLPWELRLEEKMKQVTVEQSNVKMKFECAKTLSTKYKAIRGRLRDERNLYQPILRNLNSQLTFQLTELSNLEQMLGYAQKFQKDAENTLESTEKEASMSRKMRRAQISRMRREMQRIVQEEQMSLQGKSTERSEVRKDSMGLNDTSKHGHHNSTSHHGHSHSHAEGLFHTESSLVVQDTEEQLLNERLSQKRAIIDTFNDNAALLVSVMKIPNLTHIPKRMETVISLTDILKTETESKMLLKDNLIKQRDQLMQLLCVIQYTGSGHVTQNNLVIEDYEKTFKELEQESAMEQEWLNQDAQMMTDMQLGISALIQRIEGMDRKPVHIKSTQHLMNMLPVFYEKLDNLVQSWNELKNEVPKHLDVQAQIRKQTQNRMAALIQQVPAKFIRVGENVEVEEVSEEEEFEDFKVPGRAELKLRSEKIVEQGLLKRGITSGKKQQRTDLKRSLGNIRQSVLSVLTQDQRQLSTVNP